MNTKLRVTDAIGYLVIAVLLSSLLSMSVARRRVAARRESCENRLKQIGLAFHNDHSAYKELTRAISSQRVRRLVVSLAIVRRWFVLFCRVDRAPIKA